MKKNGNRFPQSLFRPGEGGCLYTMRDPIVDLRGRMHVLNEARRITLWRRLRARLGWTERDTLLAKKDHHPEVTP